jgi:hypothetical protein
MMKIACDRAIGNLIIALLAAFMIGCASTPPKTLFAAPDITSGQTRSSLGSGTNGIEILDRDLLIVVEVARGRSYQDLELGDYGTPIDILVVNSSENRQITLDPKNIRVRVDDKPASLMTKADIERKAASKKVGEGFRNALLLGTAIMAGAYAADAESYGADPVAVSQLGDAAAKMAAYAISNQLSAADQANQIARAQAEHFRQITLTRRILGPSESHGGFIIAKSRAIRRELLVELDIAGQTFRARFQAR